MNTYICISHESTILCRLQVLHTLHRHDLTACAGQKTHKLEWNKTLSNINSPQLRSQLVEFRGGPAPETKHSPVFKQLLHKQYWLLYYSVHRVLLGPNSADKYYCPQQIRPTFLTRFSSCSRDATHSTSPLFSACPQAKNLPKSDLTVSFNTPNAASLSSHRGSLWWRENDRSRESRWTSRLDYLCCSSSRPVSLGRSAETNRGVALRFSAAAPVGQQRTLAVRGTQCDTIRQDSVFINCMYLVNSLKIRPV